MKPLEHEYKVMGLAPYAKSEYSKEIKDFFHTIVKVDGMKVIHRNRPKNLYKHLNIVDWGEIPDFDMIINATSVGLNKQESLNLDFSKMKDKFFYDVIYNPNETDFLKNAKKLKNTIENGKKMFVYQAAAAFKIWHGIEPKINNKIFELLD